MFIFKIERVEEDGVRYDKNAGFVIIASSEVEVRELAASHAADEGKQVWFDCQVTQCTLIGVALPNQEKGVVLQDFNAG